MCLKVKHFILKNVCLNYVIYRARAVLFIGDFGNYTRHNVFENYLPTPPGNIRDKGEDKNFRLRRQLSPTSLKNLTHTLLIYIHWLDNKPTVIIYNFKQMYLNEISHSISMKLTLAL